MRGWETTRVASGASSQYLGLNPNGRLPDIRYSISYAQAMCFPRAVLRQAKTQRYAVLCARRTGKTGVDSLLEPLGARSEFERRRMRLQTLGVGPPPPIDLTPISASPRRSLSPSLFPPSCSPSFPILSAHSPSILQINLHQRIPPNRRRSVLRRASPSPAFGMLLPFLLPPFLRTLLPPHSP